MATGPEFDSTLVIDPQKLAELLRGTNGPVVRRLLEDGELVKTEAQRRVGVHKPDFWGRPKNRTPGTLRDSIVKRLRDVGGNVSVEVGSADPIALIHHEGTEPHKIPKTGGPSVVVFPSGDVRVFTVARPANHPGTKPNRYLVDALAVLRGRY